MAHSIIKKTSILLFIYLIYWIYKNIFLCVEKKYSFKLYLKNKMLFVLIGQSGGSPAQAYWDYLNTHSSALRYVQHLHSVGLYQHPVPAYPPMVVQVKPRIRYSSKTMEGNQQKVEANILLLGAENVGKSGKFCSNLARNVTLIYSLNYSSNDLCFYSSQPSPCAF